MMGDYYSMRELFTVEVNEMIDEGDKRPPHPTPSEIACHKYPLCSNSKMDFGCVAGSWK